MICVWVCIPKGGMIVNKNIAAGVAAAVAAASIATNLSFDPDELVHSAAYLDSHTKYMQVSELGDLEIEYTEPEEPTRQDQLRTWLLKLPVPVKALVLLPLWALGAIPVAIGTAVLGAAAPVWAHIVSFLMNAGILFGVFCLIYKLIFPDRRISELFKNKKNRRWLLFGVVAVTGADLLIGMFWSGWSAARLLILVVIGFGVLCLLWNRICGRLKAPEPKIRRTKLKLEY